MEPFTIRCETCRAKLRVRDERVLGQIHECPRCGSMVLIAVPGAAVAAAETKTQAATATASAESISFPATSVSASAEATFAAALPVPQIEAPVEASRVQSPASFDWSRVAFWWAGGAALFVAGGIMGAVLLRGGDAETRSVEPPVQVATVDEPSLPEPEATLAEPEEEMIPGPPAVAITEQVAVVESTAVAEPVAAENSVEKSQPAATVESLAPATVSAEAPQEKAERTFTLEPVAPKASMGELAAALEAPAYETIVEPVDVAAPGDAKTQADAAPLAATNIDDRLSMPILGMEINAMPLSSFVETMSAMAAVPIVLDEATMKAAGVTERTKVSVRAGRETIDSLLTKTLARHKLAWEERNGEIVVVPAR